MEKIKIQFGKVKRVKHTQFYCGIGDGIHDGLFGYGATQLDAFKDFVLKFNKDTRFNLCVEQTVPN